MKRYITPLMSLLAMAGVFGSAVSAAQSQQSAPARLPVAHLAVGDDVVVMVFQEPDLSARVYVDDRGQIALPRLGVLDVGGLTSEMLRDTVRARYATFLRDPSVDVRALRRVTVNGQVRVPNVYYVDPTMTLRDVIARAGGLTSEGSMSKLSLVRGAQATSYPDWSTTMEGLTELRSGDQVIVGKRRWLALNAGVLVGAAGVLTSLAIALFR